MPGSNEVIDTSLVFPGRLLRMMSILMSIDMVQNMINPAIWILGEERSVIYTVSRLSSSSAALAIAWILTALLMLPFLITQIANIRSLLSKRLAVLGSCSGGVIWVYLAFLARNLDYQNVMWIFIFNGLISIAMGGVLAISINDEQILKEETLDAA